MARRGKRLQRLQWLIGITSLIVGTTTWFSYKVVRSLLLDNLKRNALLEVRQSANELDQWLVEQKTAVMTLANTPSLRSMDWATVGPFLGEEVQQMDDFYFFGLIYPDGSYYNTEIGWAEGKNLRDRQHFQEALNGNVYASDPVLSRTLGIPVVVITAPIWANASHTGDPAGVLSGLIDIDRVTDVVGKLAYGDDSYALALSTAGVPIVHPEPDRMGTRNDQVPSLLDSSDPHEVAIAKAMVAGNQDIERTQLDGQAVYVAYIPLREADWSIALVIPRNNIESQLHLLDLLALLVAGLLITLLLILWHGHNWEKAQLKRSKELADTANRAKSKFLANMSHELRTPLNGILGYAQILLRDRDATPSQLKHFQVIQQCGNHLLNLINDVLDIAKIEANRLELVPETFYLFPFLDSLAEIFRMRAAQKGLSFQYDIAFNLPTKVYGDPKRLRQVLMNLLSNAIKFTPTGHITFQIKLISTSDSLAEHHPSLAQDSYRIQFAVFDTGVGIPPEQIESIFKPFEQVGHPEQRQDGTGLGLAISTQILTLMASNLNVNSSLGQGSQFSFELQLPGSETQRCEQRSSSDAQTIVTGYEGPPRTILVIDDKWANRAVLVALLQSMGFITFEAVDGHDGLEKAVDHRPDLIITDLVMPRMDGFEFMHQLQPLSELQETVVIASSASVFESDRDQSLAAGAKAFLPKPIQSDTLLDLLQTHLSLRWTYCIRPSQGKVGLPEMPTSLPLEKEILLYLQDLAEMGDVDAIAHEAEQLKEKYPTAEDFLQNIREFSQNCQLDDIESLLIRYISVR